ncbi:unnamed protein product [Thelazia callipaeda]|uniref:MIF4G domain-containing protein n=1 Tax=Thelazia callipaeda TaxID=103827 RepID=A0A0N5CJW9_THECL|nr:unnamed protein product [Thelazia callipaeda]
MNCSNAVDSSGVGIGEEARRIEEELSEVRASRKGRESLVVSTAGGHGDDEVNGVSSSGYISAIVLCRTKASVSVNVKNGSRRGLELKRDQQSPFPSNASQKFTLQVAQTALGGNVTSVPPPIVTSPSAPPQSFRNETVVEVVPRPSTSAPPVSNSTSSEEIEKSAPPVLSTMVGKAPATEQTKNMEQDDTITAKVEESDEEVEKNTEQKEGSQESTREQAFLVVKSDVDRDIKTTNISDDPSLDQQDKQSELSRSLPKLFDDENDYLTIFRTFSVVEMVPEEEVENEEKCPEVEESSETVRTKKVKEYAAKQKELLQDTNCVRLDEQVYGHDYLLLIRDVVKDLFLESVLPVKASDLKDLGIDIASAPANGTITDRQRRFDGAAGPGARFIPGWVDKSQSKPKAYHGRLSDRTHSNQRVDRDRKRSTVSRPSIDRPNREPVKLHRAANAWRPERNLDANKKLYKEVRSLLNKLTPSTFEELSGDFLRFEVHKNVQQMGEVINIIFDKAVEEPNFCALYRNMRLWVFCQFDLLDLARLSDLCKMQVVKESNGAKDKSNFRSALLTRCQNTFEEKRMFDIAMKKSQLDVETDEKKKRELKIEVMELEARERRRMLGNIGFIGQLYRHELIVPRILNWCIVHLLKNHSESPNGDEESIECAVKMLEAVGKLADRHYQQQQALIAGGLLDPLEVQKDEFNTSLYLDHLKEISNQVSNRVRFLILNLIELKNNNWVPRTSVSGPKTLDEVHDEARREEMANRLQREQYTNKKRYEGRASLDKRNQKPVLIGRQSQDGRQYGVRGSDSSRDQKARAAGAASLVANTASRKNQTLNSVDQPQLLGARRPLFAGGAIGGGQQTDRNILPRVPGRGVSRGPVASRDNSEPSSREPSESRKQSRDGDRISAVASNTIPHSASAGTFVRGYTGATPSGSSPTEDEKENNQVERGGEFDEKKMLALLQTEIHEYCNNLITIDQIFESIIEAVTVEGTEDIIKYRVQQAFRLLVKIGAEKISGEIRNSRRRFVGQVICRCLQRADIKSIGLQGVADYCMEVVEMELWEDNMLIWDLVAEVISWSIMCEVQHFEGPRPSLGDFREAFKNADADSRKPNILLVNVLKRLVEIEHERDGQVSSAGMAFDEIKDLHSDSLVNDLKSCQLPLGKNLYQLLLN